MRTLKRLFPTREVVGVADARGAARRRQYPLHHPAGARARPAAERPDGPIPASKWNFAARAALESHYSTHPYILQPVHQLEPVVHLLLQKIRSQSPVRAVVCAAAIVAAGCHRQPNTSGYGIAWVT